MQNQSKITFVLSFFHPFSLSFTPSLGSVLLVLSFLSVRTAVFFVLLYYSLFTNFLLASHLLLVSTDFFACVWVTVPPGDSKSLCKITDLHFALTFWLWWWLPALANHQQPSSSRVLKGGRHPPPHRSHMFKRSDQIMTFDPRPESDGCVGMCVLRIVVPHTLSEPGSSHINRLISAWQTHTHRYPPGD